MARSAAPATFGEFAVAAVGELVTPAVVQDRIRSALDSVGGSFAGARLVNLATGDVRLIDDREDELAFRIPVHAGLRAGPFPVKVGATVDFDLTLRVHAHRPGVLRLAADPVSNLRLQVSGSGLLPRMSGTSSKRATAASIDGVIGRMVARQKVDVLEKLTGRRSDEGSRIPFAHLGPELFEACADPAVILRLVGRDADSPHLELVGVQRLGRAPRSSDRAVQLTVTARLMLHFPVQDARFRVPVLVQTTATVTTTTKPATVRIRFGSYRARLEGPPRRIEGPRRPVPAWWLGRVVRRRVLSRLPELLTPREFVVAELAAGSAAEPAIRPLDSRIVISEKCRANGERFHAMTLGEGQSVVVRARLERSVGAIGAPHAEVAICDGTGGCAVVQDTDFGENDRAVIGFAFTAPHAGQWKVRIRDTGEGDAGAAFSYRLQVKPG